MDNKFRNGVKKEHNTDLSRQNTLIQNLFVDHQLKSNLNIQISHRSSYREKTPVHSGGKLRFNNTMMSP